MDILVENLQEVILLDLKSVRTAVTHFFKFHNIECDEVNIYFVDPITIGQLHDQHFNDPSHTDCISIQIDPIGESPCFLGEVYISPQAAVDYVKKHPADLYQELTLYLVHGLLHLLGYDDIKDEDRTKMRLAEKNTMNYLLDKKSIITK